MGRQAAVVLYVLALVAVVVGVDVLLFRNRFWERLIVNVGIVLVFAAFYLRFLKHPCAGGDSRQGGGGEGGVGALLAQRGLSALSSYLPRFGGRGGGRGRRWRTEWSLMTHSGPCRANFAVTHNATLW